MRTLLQDNPGVYRVLLPRVELVVPEAKDLYEKFGVLLNREEVYCYALGMINETELEDLHFHLQYLELDNVMQRFSDLIKDHYQFSLPDELRNDECFSLTIMEYNDEADIYVFTCEVPPAYAVDKHGIDFEYLKRYFPNRSA